MKGTLLRSGNKWLISYDENDYTVTLDVRPEKIQELSMSANVSFNNGDPINFAIENVSHFPYRYAVPYLDDKPQATSTIRMKKQKKITIWLAGFGMSDWEEIICDAYDVSSNGYWYFYNQIDSGREYVGAYPIARTAIHKIEEVEIEIK